MKTSTMWWIRITAPHEHIKAKVPAVKGWIDYSCSMIAYHSGDTEVENPHCHIALKMTSSLQKQSLDVRIKKLFDVAGSQYSCVPWDGDKQVLRYCYHEQAEGKSSEVLHDMKDLTPADVEQLRSESKIITKAVNEAKATAGFKVIDYVLDKIKSSGTKMEAYEIGWEIQKVVFKGLFHEPGDYNMEKYINEILCRQCENETELERMWADRHRRLKIFSKI